MIVAVAASLLAGAIATVPTVSAQAAPPAAASTSTTAADDSIVSGDARFEVLSPTLIRTEFAGDAKFVDAATFNAIGRDSFPNTPVTHETVDGWLTITTSAVTLAYKVGSGSFTKDNLRLTEANGTQTVTAAPWASITAPTCTTGTLCEAEDLDFKGLTLATDHSGYTGHGFVGGFANVGDSLSFTVNAPAAGDYDIDARYANSTGGDGKNVTRTLSVSADGGTASTLSLPPTTNWDTWNVVTASLHLRAGANTITVAHTATDSGNVNFDSVAAVATGAPYPGVAAPVATPCAFGSICELDSGTLAGGAKVAFDHNNYSGNGFVAGMETATATDKLTVTGVPSGGRYALQLRYANSTAGVKGTKSRNVSVTVGSATATTATLATTSSWDTWRTVAIPVDLTAGDNVVSIGCPDADGCNVNLDTVAFAGTGSVLLDPHAPLGGYRRSLDRVDGGALTNPGLLYQDGWSLIDDGASDIFNTSTQALTPRPSHGSEGYQDGYVFGYGKDYTQALQDLATLTGPPKLLPRWAYGVWYSEYYDRTAKDYQDTILPKFRSEGVPLDVLVTDTDFKAPNQWNGWEIDPAKFPDPKAYFDWAHSEGLHTSLNIHPSILASDPQFAQAQATAKGKLQPGSCSGGGTDCYVFDFGDPDQLKAYLGLHDTMQAAGNDLWWLDWCCDSSTSSATGISGDALINLAYADYTAKTVDRGFAFSRAYGSLATGGYGNSATSSTGPWADKRTTLHFTGDTISDWSTLAYEVGYTPGESSATGMSSISHDIGGHTDGAQTTGAEPGSMKLADDLYARWVQLGTFQPIDRLHSNHSDRLPWQYGAAAESSADKFLKLREGLVPYTYSLAQQSSTTGMPIVQGLYLQYPDQQEAYANADSEYLYGPDVLVAPVTTPGTGSVTTNVWFPAGSSWTDYFTGITYAGGTTAAVTTDLSTMPVFIKSGGILTTRTDNVTNDVQNPLTKVGVTVAGGANGSFSLYEDNGTTTDTTQSATTVIDYTETGGVRSLYIAAAKGNYAGQVANRQWTARFTDAEKPTSVTVDGKKLAANGWSYDASTRTVTVALAQRPTGAATTISYTTNVPQNNAPTVAPVAVTTHAGKVVRITPKASDADGDKLTYAYSRPAHGTVRGSGASVVYTPAAKFVGTDRFRVTVTDTSGATATATITVKVTNKAPTASAISKRTTVAASVAINLRGADPDHDRLTYTHTRPVHGTVTGSGAALRYTASRTFAGVDRFSFTVTDPFGGKVTRTVTIHVARATPTVAVNVSPGHLTASKSAVLTVKVSVPNKVSADGASVTVKEGSRTLDRDHVLRGTVKVTLPRLAKGRHRMTVTVGATKVTSSVAKQVTVTVS